MARPTTLGDGRLGGMPQADQAGRGDPAQAEDDAGHGQHPRQVHGGLGLGPERPHQQRCEHELDGQAHGHAQAQCDQQPAAYELGAAGSQRTQTGPDEGGKRGQHHHRSCLERPADDEETEHVVAGDEPEQHLLQPEGVDRRQTGDHRPAAVRPRFSDRRQVHGRSRPS